MEQNKSTWHIPCECGETVQTQERETACKCGRVLSVQDWGSDAEVIIG